MTKKSAGEAAAETAEAAEAARDVRCPSFVAVISGSGTTIRL